MPTKNIPESRQVAAAIDAVGQECYYNAFRALNEIPEYRNATYVEGMAVIGGVFQIEHGWLEYKGEVIDPTIPDEEAAYFPGLKFNGFDEVYRAMLTLKKSAPQGFPLFYRLGWAGSESPEMNAAREQAQAFVFPPGRSELR